MSQILIDKGNRNKRMINSKLYKALFGKFVKFTQPKLLRRADDCIGVTWTFLKAKTKRSVQKKVRSMGPDSVLLRNPNSILCSRA